MRFGAGDGLGASKRGTDKAGIRKGLKERIWLRVPVCSESSGSALKFVVG